MAAKSVEDIFLDIVDKVRSFDPANSRSWFDELTVIGFDGGTLQVGCPDESIASFLNDNSRRYFTQAAQQVTGHLVSVEFLIATSSSSDILISNGMTVKLHPDYTFGNFVVGPSNRLAHASCIAVSQSLGDTYNPLFLYGNSGLGKTHLLHAVCDETKKRNSNAIIELLSCEDFVNLFIRAIEEGNLAGFQSQFRTVDLLIIDDVQFLREREQSQEEFFHTFNALYNNGKQIILSSDRAPTDIPSLEERLISRFNWGLVTRIDPPSHDTRVAIVKKKSHLRGMEISDEISEYIARKMQANIREIEGALTTIYAVGNALGQPITLALARQALEGQIESSARQISITDIIDVVTRHFDVRLADLQSKKRNQSITVPRQICMYLARNLTRHSLEEIGGHLGGRDHTTVLHSYNKIDKIQAEDLKMRAMIDDLTRQTTGLQA